jgi:hypothetical protein
MAQRYYPDVELRLDRKRGNQQVSTTKRFQRHRDRY